MVAPTSEIQFRDSDGVTVGIRTHKISRVQNMSGVWVDRIVPNTEQIESYESNPRYTRVGSINMKLKLAKLKKEEETLQEPIPAEVNIPPHESGVTRVNVLSVQEKAALTRAERKISEGKDLTPAETAALNKSKGI